MKPSCVLCCAVLDAEKQFMEAAKTNDVETMKTLGKRLNANAKNVVGLNIEILFTLHCIISHRLRSFLGVWRNPY